MTSVLISGASIAGPTLAYWLRKSGFAPTLIERATAMRPGGQAIDIRGRALAVMNRMELLATARQKRTQMRGVSMIDETGKEIWRSEERTLSGGRFDHDDVEILKDDLGALLYDATKNDCEYLFRTTIASLAEDAAGVSVTFDNGATRRFDLVIAADGLRSNTRRMVFGDDDAIYRDLGSHLAVFTAPNFLALDNWQIGYRNERAGFLIYPARDNAELRVAFGFGSDPSDNVRDVQAQKALVAQRCAGFAVGSSAFAECDVGRAGLLSGLDGADRDGPLVARSRRTGGRCRLLPVADVGARHEPGHRRRLRAGAGAGAGLRRSPRRLLGLRSPHAPFRRAQPSFGDHGASGRAPQRRGSQ